MGLNSESSDPILRVLPLSCVLTVVLGSVFWNTLHKFRHAMGFFFLLQAMMMSSALSRLKATIYTVLQSRRCVNVYCVLVLVSLAEAILAKTCGMPFPQLTQLVALGMPMITMFGFMYSAINIEQTAEFMLLTILRLINLLAPLQIFCLCLALRFVLCAAVDNGHMTKKSLLFLDRKQYDIL